MVYDGLMGCGDHSADFPVWCEESKVEDSSAVGSQVDLHTAKPGPGCRLIAIVETSDKIASWLEQFYWFIGLVYLHDQTGRLRLQACSPLTLCLRKGKSPCDEVSREQ